MLSEQPVLKLAFADRNTYVSDPAFVDVPIAQLLSKSYAEQQRARINSQKATPYFAAGLEKEGDIICLEAVPPQAALLPAQNLFRTVTDSEES